MISDHVIKTVTGGMMQNIHLCIHRNKLHLKHLIKILKEKTVI